MFSSCVFCICFFKLPSVWKKFALKKFSHKSCNFCFMCCLYVFLQIAFSPKNFAIKVANFFFMCFFVRGSSNWLRSEKLSHKSCNFFYHMCLLYVFLQIAFGPKNFATKIAIFSWCGFCICFFKLPSVYKFFPQSLHLKIFPQKSQFFLHVFWDVFLQIWINLTEPRDGKKISPQLRISSNFKIPSNLQFSLNLQISSKLQISPKLQISSKFKFIQNFNFIQNFTFL